MENRYRMKIPDRVKARLKELPDAPGCYLMRNRNGKIIYVGKARSLRKRVQSYFRDATLRRSDPKLRSLVKSVADIEYMVVRNEAEAVLTEGRLIKDYKPRYNVAFRDDKRFLLIRVDPDEPWPRLRLVRIEQTDGARYLGPYASSRAARETVDFTEKRFGLRKCGPRIPDAETYRHCINDIVRFCSAPCVGKISRDEYLARLDDACAFLRGEKPELVVELRREMDNAAEALDFERAAALRDTVFMLDRTVRQNARVAKSPEMQQQAARKGLEELQQHLSLPALPDVIEAFDVSNISGTNAVASMVCAVDGLPRRNRYRRFRIASVEAIDDPRMMAEVVRRRYSRLLDEQAELPGLVLVDGGITQRHAAQAELRNLGLPELPIAGLAKQYEEIYFGDSHAPLRLPRESEALQVLQRLRDEAHRFAITYHRKLRGRRIRESVLDDIPGVGRTRKAALLKHFGSVRRLSKASDTDIAAVPGFGKEMARLIRAELSRLRKT